MKRKVKARILINLLLSYDEQATIMFVLVVAQFYTCHSRFVPALVPKCFIIGYIQRVWSLLLIWPQTLCGKSLLC
ncbi:hypothetical protein OROHE_007836 [Orobanche hederae]